LANNLYGKPLREFRWNLQEIPLGASKLLSVCLISFILASLFILVGYASDEEDATTAIQRGETAIASAYQAILDTESVGANVSSLLSRLGEAAELLAGAHMSFVNGDSANAALLANSSAEIAASIRVEAYETRDLTLHENSLSFQFSLAESILGLCVVIVATFISWRLFRRHYLRRVLKLKPELDRNEP
jgi:hypothetical protein